MKLFFILIPLLLLGCSSITPKPGSVSDTKSVAGIETVNYTPFPSVVGSSDDTAGPSFHGFAVKVTFAAMPKGASTLSTEQIPFLERGSAINELPAFRKSAEVYLVTSDSPIKRGTIAINGASTDIRNAEWIVRERAYGLTLLAPYIRAGDTISVAAGERTLRFAVPKLFSPYLLARYETGAMMPTPMRADTIIIDLDMRTMSVVYRTTIPTVPSIRVAEFRLIVDPTESYPGSSLAETRARFEEQQSYLHACPISESPIEPCAVPDRLPARAFFE